MIVFRGYIWININYLAISALHHYKSIAGNHQHRCQLLYTKLRNNIINIITINYNKTGFFWEQYDDETGEGIRGHPFTGWTALVVNIIAEKY